MGESLAQESKKTIKTREKLKKRLESLDRDITDQALKRKSVEIHRWIARHAEDRVPLKAKSIALFDENQHAAKLSIRVSNLATSLQNDL